jgi:hypothetical protein
MTQYCHSLGTHSPWRELTHPPFPPTKLLLVYRVLPSRYSQVAVRSVEVSFFHSQITANTRLPQAFTHPPLPTTVLVCRALYLAIYFQWWCTNKIQEEDNHTQKDDRDNSWRNFAISLVFLCMFRPIIHKKRLCFKLFFMLFLSGLANGSFCILQILTRSYFFLVTSMGCVAHVTNSME